MGISQDKKIKNYIIKLFKKLSELQTEIHCVNCIIHILVYKNKLGQ